MQVLVLEEFGSYELWEPATGGTISIVAARG